MPDQTRLQHAKELDVMRKFARRRHISEDLVEAVFERERSRLARDAKVEAFVDVLAEKRTKRVLKQMTP